MHGQGPRGILGKVETYVLVGRPIRRSHWLAGKPTDQYYLETSDGRNSLGRDGIPAALPEVSEPKLQGSIEVFLNKNLNNDVLSLVLGRRRIRLWSVFQ